MIKKLKLYKTINGSKKTGTVLLMFGVLLAVLGFLLTNHFAEIINLYGGASIMLLLTGSLAGILILALGIVRLINSMYMTNDIEQLVTLPFGSSEIAFMRVMDFGQFALFLGIVIVLAPNAGFAFGISAAPAYWAALILGGLLIPVFGTCIDTVIVVLLMSFLKIFRNRQTLRIIGAFCLFALLCLYMFVSQGDKSGGAAVYMQTFTKIAKVLQYLFPVSSAMTALAVSQNLLYLPAMLALTAASVLLFYLVTRALYLRGTLNMLDDRIGSAPTDAEFNNLCQKKSIPAALQRKEYLMTKRNSVFILNNFIIGALWPILGVLILKGLYPMIGDFLQKREADAALTAFNLSNFALYGSILSALLFMIVFLPLTCHSLAYTALTREGIDFPWMKQIPVSYREQLEAKRRMSLRVARICIMIYVVIIMILISAILHVPFVYCILPIILTWIFISLNIHSDMYFGIQSADVNWSNEKEAGKKGSVAVILNMVYWIAALTISGILIFMSFTRYIPAVWSIAGLCLLGVLMAAGSLLFKRGIFKTGEKKIRRMRF